MHGKVVPCVQRRIGEGFEFDRCLRVVAHTLANVEQRGDRLVVGVGHHQGLAAESLGAVKVQAKLATQCRVRQSGDEF